MVKDLETFFSKIEEDRIIKSIQNAEAETSGEIRVHISTKDTQDALLTTEELFHELRMFNTHQRNGVLIHLSITSKTFAIYGDVGINQVVPPDFWESTKTIMQKHFAENEIVDGICAGVNSVGKQLKAHFPWKTDDKNELSDEVSYD